MDLIEEAQITLVNVENAAAKMGLHLNADKTESMIFNQEHKELKTRNNEKIKVVEDFKYLGAWVGR